MTPPSEPRSSTWQAIKNGVDLTSKIATIILPAVAIYATAAYNKQQEAAREATGREQAALQQVQTVIGLVDPLASSDPKKRHDLAVLTLNELSHNVPLAIKLCLASASQSECATSTSRIPVNALLLLSGDSSRADPAVQQTAQAALDVRQATPDTQLGRSQLLAAAVPTADSAGRDSARSGALRRGWIYLGAYRDSAWTSRYLDFPASAAPGTLKGRTFAVRKETGALNVRGNLFYEAGYDRIVDVLAPNSTVTLDSIASYANADYFIWALATYRGARLQP